MSADRLRHLAHDGLRFDVRDDGPTDGVPVVALHGFPQTSASWSGVTPVLAAAGCRVLAPDQRGYSPGARPWSVSAYRVDRLAGDVLALADAAGLETFHLLGHDWGGAVAWHLAARHPDRVRTLSVASTPHPQALAQAMLGRQALRSWYMGFFQLPVVPELVIGGGDDRVRRLLTRSGIPDPDAVAAFLDERGAARGALNWYRAFLRPGSPGTPAVRVPTLYVWSDGDFALGRRAAEATERWVEADYRFVVLPGVSHWIPDEEPVELAELVLDRIGASGLA